MRIPVNVCSKIRVGAQPENRCESPSMCAQNKSRRTLREDRCEALSMCIQQESTCLILTCEHKLPRIRVTTLRSTLSEIEGGSDGELFQSVHDHKNTK